MSKRVKNTKSTNNAEMKKILKMSKESFKNEQKQRKLANNMDEEEEMNKVLKLSEDFYKIEEFSALNMGMKISHWHAEPTSHGINFVGYRIWQTHKLLRKQSVIRAKRRIDSCIRHKDFEGLDKFLGSWLGHALWADSHNLFNWMEQKYELTTHYQ